MPSQAEVSNFQRLLVTLGAAAVTAVQAMWRTTELQDVKDAYPEVLLPFIAASGSLAAEWYYSLNPDAPFAIEAAPLPQPPVLSASVGWSFSQADPLTALAGSSERHVFTSARETVVSNAQREGVTWARYASANACPWCRVLATREAVYKSADNAIKGHDNCHCLAVPVREGDIWTPPDYVQGWAEEYNAARAAVGGDLNSIVNHMRTNS